MEIKSYAKINLGLHIVGKRDDGFHNIDTLFHHVNLFDEITLKRTADTTLTCSDPAIPTDSRNLSRKAAELFKKTYGISDGIAIHINKRIPSGAGLGGGSSNAAATLLALRQMFGVPKEVPALESIALQLGSDVPFFLKGGSAFGESRGERLNYFSLRIPYWIVLVNPGIHISTPWAYETIFKKYNGNFPVKEKLKDVFLSNNDLPKLQNDFEEIVFAEHPVIASLKTSMLNRHAIHALMSGSGSTVFGLFENFSDAESVIEIYAKKYFTHLTEPNFILEHV